MASYAIAHLRNVTMNQGIVDYLQGIDATLAPFNGRFIIHGGPKVQLEGAVDDDIIVIAFPDMRSARHWYDSPAYQALKPQRAQGAEGEVFLIDGVDANHKAADILPADAAAG
ncbi:MAG: DUF1330 domain-containing protein [Paracoccaceae bacterium]